MSERYPPYLPAYYKVFLKLRKVYRQTMVRLSEDKARRKGPIGIISDGEASWYEGDQESIPDPKDAINKSAIWLDEDMKIPGVKEAAEGIEALKKELDGEKLCFTTTAATFLKRMFYERTERTKLWENAWTVYHSGVKVGDRVLDVGGASTIFSFYLANMGCSVAVVDNDWNNCGVIYNSNYVAKAKGWELKTYDRDVFKPLPFVDNYFDHIFSICVIEHLPSVVRRYMMKELGRVIKPGGIVSLTTDYDHGRKVLMTDKGLRFAYREKIEEDVVKPSGLAIHGNKDWIDVFPNQNFLGALFLRKTA